MTPLRCLAAGLALAASTPPAFADGPANSATMRGASSRIALPSPPEDGLPLVSGGSGQAPGRGPRPMLQARNLPDRPDKADAPREPQAAPVFTPQMFGAACASDGTAGAGPDDTVALQSAIDAAEATGGTVYIPGKRTMCRTTAPLVITRHLTVTGDYCQPYTSLDATTPQRGAGSWLFFDHAGVGISVPADGVPGGTATGYSSSVATTGTVLQNFCTDRAQPAFVSSGTWAPRAFDFDIKAMQDDTAICHVMLLNPTNGLSIMGRYTIDDLRGDPYLVGIDSELSEDVPRILNVHFWPFDGINTAAGTYKKANLTALILGRVDNPIIENFFSIGAKFCIHMIRNGFGIPNKVHGMNIDCDLVGDTGLLSEAPGATAQFVNFTTQGDGTDTATDSVNGVDINAAGSTFAFTNLRVTNVGGVGVIVQGKGSVASLNGLEVDKWGMNGVPGTAAVEADGAGTIASVGTGFVFYPGTGLSSTFWAGTGTVTVATGFKSN